MNEEIPQKKTGKQIRKERRAELNLKEVETRRKQGKAAQELNRLFNDIQKNGVVLIPAPPPKEQPNIGKKRPNDFTPLDTTRLPRADGIDSRLRIETHGYAPDMGKPVPSAIDQAKTQHEGYDFAGISESDDPESISYGGSRNPESLKVEVTQYRRDTAIKVWVLRNAKGRCECCNKTAPFRNADGTPYLEVHHVRRLADSGSDTLSNTVALCPNCHREVHHGANKESLVIHLHESLKRLIPE